MRRAVVALITGLLGAASAGQAAAPNRCVVSVTPVQFGVYNGLRPGDVRSTGTVVYNCMQSSPITISISRGGASFLENRRMNQAGFELSYNLYLDPAGTIIWGDGTGGSQVYRDPAPAPNTNISVPVYARVAALQRGARTGFYDDTLVVTINY
jgi:spore coat protein U-like protein